MSDDRSAGATARTLLRVVRHGALATLDRASGFPYASLVGVASAPCGSPVLLLSQLARHTKNIDADPRVSILLSAIGAGDPLASPRLTVFGTIARSDDPALAERYLARNPKAVDYAGFGDFSVYRIAVERGHLIAGFGRIVELPAAELLTDIAGAEDLVAAETAIAEHMNEDHRDAVQLYATTLLGAAPGAWRFVGCDPDGAEIADGDAVLRLPFGARVTTATGVRMQLVELARRARTPA